MLSTPRFAIPYPEDIDNPDGPAQYQAIAEKLEELLGYAGARSGKSIVAAEQTTTAAAYTLLGTPDRVQGIEVGEEDLLVIAFDALVKCASDRQGLACLFIDAQPVKFRAVQNDGTTVLADAAARMPWNNYWCGLTTWPGGLVAQAANAQQAAAPGVGVPVALGQVIDGGEVNNGEYFSIGEHSDADGGGDSATFPARNFDTGIGGSGGGLHSHSVSVPGDAPVDVFGGGAHGGLCIVHNVAAGTREVSVRFRSIGGNLVSVKNRKLWAWTQEFPG